VSRHLRQLPCNERLEGADPGQGHEAEGQVDVVVRVVPGHAVGAVGDPAQAAQEGELVGGALVVVEDDVAEQGQGTGAVVRQPDGDLRPGDVVASHAVRALAGGFHPGAVLAGEPAQLVDRDLVHAPVRVDGPLAERHGQQAAGLEQGDQLAEGAGPGGRRHVHPYRAEQDQVEGHAQPVDDREVRQAVVEPADAWMPVARLSLAAQPLGGLDRDDLVAAPGQPRGVAAAARADVEHRGVAALGQPVEQPVVDLGERQRLVALGRRRGVGVVPGNARVAGGGRLAHGADYGSGGGGLSSVMGPVVSDLPGRGCRGRGHSTVLQVFSKPLQS